MWQVGNDEKTVLFLFCRLSGKRRNYDRKSFSLFENCTLSCYGFREAIHLRKVERLDEFKIPPLKSLCCKHLYTNRPNPTDESYISKDLKEGNSKNN